MAEQSRETTAARDTTAPESTAYTPSSSAAFHPLSTTGHRADTRPSRRPAHGEPADSMLSASVPDVLTSGDLPVDPSRFSARHSEAAPDPAPDRIGPDDAGARDHNRDSTEKVGADRRARPRHAAVPGDDAPTIPLPTVPEGTPASPTSVATGWQIVSPENGNDAGPDPQTLIPDSRTRAVGATARTDAESGARADSDTVVDDRSPATGDATSTATADDAIDDAALPDRAEDVPTDMPGPDGSGPEYAIQAVDLQKRFGEHVAVHSVSFSVEKGSILALLGPNGAGKTTTVNMLCTLLKPDGGTALVAGHDVASDAAGVRRSIMLTGQFAALDEALSGRDNLILFGRLMGLSKSSARARADELLTSFDLTAAGKRKVGEYSGGMRRRIDIACGLVTQPEVVFLDEPTTGLDPRSRQDVWNLVESLRDQGVTTLLTTQYLEEADTLSDHIVVIDRGRVIASGTADELKAATGASHYEVTPADPHDLPRLTTCLDDLITDGPAEHADTDAATSVAVPAPDGADTLVEIVQRTTTAGIRLSDVALRRPSLDEVFLALTDPSKADASRTDDTTAAATTAAMSGPESST
jgi:ABC-2 type transport system ATP-binding protein